MSELQFKVSVDRYESIPLLRINVPEILTCLHGTNFYLFIGHKEEKNIQFGGIRPQFITHRVFLMNNLQNLQ